MEVLETLYFLFQKCRGIRCGTSKVGDSQIALTSSRNVIFQKKGEKDLPMNNLFNRDPDRKRTSIAPEPAGFGLGPDNQMNWILPGDPGFIDHEPMNVLDAARVNLRNTNPSLVG